MTPALSVEAVQDTLTDVSVDAVDVRPVGVVGASPSAEQGEVVADATAWGRYEALPAAS